MFLITFFFVLKEEILMRLMQNVDVVIENNKMKKFLLDNKVEFENLSSEFIKKIK